MTNVKTTLYCIFGNPVSHSLSPVMHNRAFIETGINSIYLAFQPATIEKALESCRTLPILGSSITIPYKIDVIPYLDSIDPLAEKIGAVNTLKNDNGRITGYNTDGSGAVKALESAGCSVSGSRILIIGNGGSARAIGFALLDQGGKVTVAARNPEKAEKLSADLNQYYPGTDAVAISDLDMDIMSDINIVINTTSAGMAPNVDESPIPEKLLMPEHTVFDIVYSPHNTKLLSKAEETGCTTVRGIEMLLYQGILQFELWTGHSAPDQAMREALTNAVGKK